jgi:hypothetical protein
MIVGCRHSLGACGLIALLFSAGCGARQYEGEPVTGSVTKGGAGVESVLVIFTPQKDGITKAGRTDAGGKFELKLPPGKYKVMISKKVTAQGQLPPPGDDLSELEAAGALSETIPEQYSSPASSQLSAEIPDGGAELPPFVID